MEEINTKNLRDLESFVTQETQLFHDSIKNNLRIAKLTATDEEIETACKKASVHDFIMTLPKGYDTPVGELGDTLSGGERQRLGLARAFLHDAPSVSYTHLDVYKRQGFRRFFNPSTGCLEQFCNRKSIDNKMVTDYTEFALRKMRIIKAVYFIIRSPCLLYTSGICSIRIPCVKAWDCHGCACRLRFADAG